jgi:DNA-binding GntR family transcriptional regulator
MDNLEQYLLNMDPVQETDSRLLRQIAYERLKDALKHASVLSGDPLSEVRISKALSISRTPVREAIQQLAQDGLVQVIPGRVITVAAPSIQDVLDALHVRELLEPELVRLAATALPDQGIKILEESVQQMEAAAAIDDQLAWAKADTVWHETLSNFCPNKLLGQLVLQARNRVLRTVLENRMSSYLVKGTDEHKEISQAILTHDADTAERLMREHLQLVKNKLFQTY